MTDRQLPLEPTIRIDPTTLVEHMPGTDAICPANRGHDCGYPFCTCHTGHGQTCSCGWPDTDCAEEHDLVTDCPRFKASQ